MQIVKQNLTLVLSVIVLATIPALLNLVPFGLQLFFRRAAPF